MPTLSPQAGGDEPHGRFVAPLIDYCALFESLTRDQRLEVAAGASVVFFKSKQQILREGDPADSMYMLLSGRAKVASRKPGGSELVWLLGRGDLCGWPSVFVEHTYAGSTWALEPTLTLAWSRPAIEGLFDRFSVLPRNALRIMARRLREEHDRYRELALERLPQRLARTLLRLARPREGAAAAPEIPLSRAELGQMTGATLFTISRTLSDWESRGLVEAGRGRVVVLDESGLTAIAWDASPDPRGDAPGAARRHQDSPEPRRIRGRP